RLEFAVHHKTHGERSGVPAACREAAKQGFTRRFVIEVVRLRIELRGERQDLLLVDPHPAGAIHLAYGIIFKVLLFAIGHFATAKKPGPMIYRPEVLGGIQSASYRSDTSSHPR